MSITVIVRMLKQENERLRATVRSLELQVEEMQRNNSRILDLLMTGEVLRDRIMLDAICNSLVR